MKKLIYLFLVFTVLISCDKDDESINVTLSSTVTGTFISATIEYKDKTGTLVSETLPAGKWNKNFTVSKGYNLFVKVKGTINGSIELEATAIGNGVVFNDIKNTNTNTNNNFELETSTTL